MAELYYEIMPESTNDDALCADFDWFEHINMMTGAMKVAAQAGVVIYDSKWRNFSNLAPSGKDKEYLHQVKSSLLDLHFTV